MIFISLPSIDSDFFIYQKSYDSKKLNNLKQQPIFLYQLETWLQTEAYFRQNTIQFSD